MIQQFLVKDIVGRLMVESLQRSSEILAVDSGDELFLSARGPSR